MSGVRLILIDNPPVNSLSRVTVERLYSGLQAAEADPSVGIVLLAGTEACFSAGADLSELSAAAEKCTSEEEIIRMYVESYATHNLAPLVHRIDSFSKPVVAFTSGIAFGGGLELALGCHYRIAMENSKFSLPEVKIGIIPGALGTQLLPRLLDFKACVDMCVYCKPIGAQKALDLGLIDQIVRKDTNGEPYNHESCLKRVILLLERQIQRGAGAPSPFRRTSELPVISTFAESLPLAYQIYSTLPPTERGGKAARGAVRCLLACLKAGPAFETGALEESEMSKILVASKESRALRYLFMAERNLQKLPSESELRDCQLYFERFAPSGDKKSKLSTNFPIKSGEISSIGVVGSGVMGSGIAAALLMSGAYSVIIIDNSQGALDRARLTVGGILMMAAAKGKLSFDAARKLHSEKLSLSTSLSSLSNSDLVIEAVFENLEVKRSLFKDLDQIVRRNCILCSNTSSLDIEAVTVGISGPDRIAGLHFFSPAHVMKLVECIVTTKTSHDTMRATMNVIKKMGKVGVIATNLPGFVGNRMIFTYVMESMLLIEEGCSVEEVDSAARNFGFPMGPCQMQDLSGLDVGYKIRKEKGLVDDSNSIASSKRDVRYSPIGDDLFRAGRLGLKSGRGFYKYKSGGGGQGNSGLFNKFIESLISSSKFEMANSIVSSRLFNSAGKEKNSGFKGNVDPETNIIINKVRSRKLMEKAANYKPSGSRNTFNDFDVLSGKDREAAILDRLLLPLINEGFKLLAEGGVASFRPSDIDIVFIYGYGFPTYKGGPMYHAENVYGLPNLLRALQGYFERWPNSEYFRPAPLLEQMVLHKVSISQLQKDPSLIRQLLEGKYMASKL